jgi:uncharacterized protein YceK
MKKLLLFLIFLSLVSGCATITNSEFWKQGITINKNQP